HKSAFTFSQAKFIGSIGLRYDLTEHIATRTALSLGSLQADDKKGTAAMQARNLNFKTSLFDWELAAQYNIFSLNQKWWTPYVFAGISVFHYNPYTKTNSGDKVYLRNMGTEGEGFVPGVNTYTTTQASIPLGIGFDYALNEDLRVGLEFTYHKTFTDYIDDVSGTYVDQVALLHARGQTAVDLAYRGYEVGAGAYPSAGTIRGDSRTKDSWYTIGLTVTCRSFIDQYKRIAGLPAYRRDKRVGCPVNRYNLVF
ncbi:MAG: outer membrane beta-barrel protein, partial [Bacteroidetes bacterium]|nr:outer membrane beta-barrel protein [Bacteroidota bacterium]